MVYGLQTRKEALFLILREPSLAMEGNLLAKNNSIDQALASILSL